MTSVSQEEQLELDKLKAEANELGIKFADNISAATLARRIATHKVAAQSRTEEPKTEVQAPVVESVVEIKAEDVVVIPQVQETPMSIQDEIKQEVQEEAAKVEVVKPLTPRENALRLIRVRVTPIDTSKRDYEGEIFSAGNAFIPTVRKFVQFNVPTHLENILYQQLIEKEYQYFVSRKRPDGSEYREGKVGKAYSVEVLPDLTKEELAELAASQHARNAIDK